MNKKQSSKDFKIEESEEVSLLEEEAIAPESKRSKKKEGPSALGTFFQAIHGLILKTARFIIQTAVMAAILFGAYTVTERLIASKPEIPQRPVFPRVYTVETTMAKEETHQPTLSLYGEIVAGRSVDLRSLVSGEVVKISNKLKAGGVVEEGESLIEIDSFKYEGALREAKANQAEINAKIDENKASIRLERSRLASGIEQLEFAKSDLARIEQLRSRGTATAKQLDDRALIVSQRQQSVEQSEINIITAEAKLAQQQAALDRLAWRIEQSERDLKDTVLVAPFSGTIRSNQIEIGKVVGANDIVVSMYQTDKLEARFVLTDERFGRIQSDKVGLVGRPVDVIWVVGGKDNIFAGKIDRIGAEVNSATGGIEIYATIDVANQPMNLRPGAFVEVRVPDKAFEKHIKLPDTSVYNGDKVYVVEEKKLVEKTVDISAFDGESALVASGISAGDEVLTTRISEVSSGLRVRKEGDPIRRPGGFGRPRGREAGSNGSGPRGEGASGNRQRTEGARRPGRRPEGARGNGGQRGDGQQRNGGNRRPQRGSDGNG